MQKLLRKAMVCCLLVTSLFSYAQENKEETCDMNCCFKDPSPVGITLGHLHYKGQWMISYKYMQMKMNGLLHGNRTVSDQDIFAANYSMSPQNMSMQMHMLMAMYGISDKVTLMGMGNFISNMMTMKPFATNHIHAGMEMSGNKYVHEMTSSGIADAKLYAMFYAFSNENISITPSLGINVPLGNITKKIAGETTGYNMQLGSGTWDGLLGLTYFHEKNDFEWGAQILSSLRLHKNNVNYRYSNDYGGNLWLSYYWSEYLSSSIRAETVILPGIVGYDKSINTYAEPGTDGKNYGGYRNSVYWGSNFYLQNKNIRNHRIGFEIGIPYYENLNGFQMKNSWNCNLQWSFTY